MTGASASALSVVLNDHSGSVGQYFNGIRIPASFLAGATFGGLFQLKPSPGGSKRTRLDTTLMAFYSTSMALSFLLSVNTIVISTAAEVTKLNGAFDPMATSGYELLNSVFHFEFVITRWCFLVSLFLFLVAVASRMLLEFKLFSTEGNLQGRNREMGVAVCLLMSSLVAHLLSYINSTLFCWNNFFDMTLDVVKTLFSRGSWSRPLEPLSFVCAIGGIILVVHALAITTTSKLD